MRTFGNFQNSCWMHGWEVIRKKALKRRIMVTWLQWQWWDMERLRWALSCSNGKFDVMANELDKHAHLKDANFFVQLVLKVGYCVAVCEWPIIHWFIVTCAQSFWTISSFCFVICIIDHQNATRMSSIYVLLACQSWKETPEWSNMAMEVHQWLCRDIAIDQQQWGEFV